MNSTPTAWEAALVLGRVPLSHVPPFQQAILQAMEVATQQQLTALAQAFPSLVVAWMMRCGSEQERTILTRLANGG